MKKLQDISDINIDSKEGRYLMAALAKITTESQTDKTPDEVLEQCHILQEEMYKDFPERQESVLNRPCNHHLIDIFKELKFGRPAANQHYLQKCIEELEGKNGVYAVNTNWEILSHPTDLENVMKPEDCRFIGTKQECEGFLLQYRNCGTKKGN